MLHLQCAMFNSYRFSPISLYMRRLTRTEKEADECHENSLIKAGRRFRREDALLVIVIADAENFIDTFHHLGRHPPHNLLRAEVLL